MFTRDVFAYMLPFTHNVSLQSCHGFLSRLDMSGPLLVCIAFTGRSLGGPSHVQILGFYPSLPDLRVRLEFW